jgi:putative aldouronate transport system permease protein
MWGFRYLYLLLLIGFLYIVVFKYLPMYGIIISFKKFSYRAGILNSPWVGLSNYAALFRLSAFWRVVGNTLWISLGKLLVAFPFPLLLAVLLNEIRLNRFKKTVQTLIYLPHFLSWVLLGGIVFNLLSVNGGLVNKILVSFGIEAKNFLVDTRYFRPVVYITQIWKESGWGTIVYLAALAGINPEYYEAAIVDGAKRFTRFRYITWPEILPTFVILFILQTGNVMNAGFDQILNLYNQAVYPVGDILDTYIYRETLNTGNLSLMTAAGTFKSVINFAFLIAVDRLAKLCGQSGLY